MYRVLNNFNISTPVWTRPGDVVDQQSAGGPSVVAPGHRSEALLASRVPDLQLDRLSHNVDHLGAELHPDCVIGILLDCKNTTQEQLMEQEEKDYYFPVILKTFTRRLVGRKFDKEEKCDCQSVFFLLEGGVGEG